MHNRYAVSHGFLPSRPATRPSRSRRIVNAFFGWEFNSCEMLVAGDEVYPIDYANACPDVAVTSLHYYFPWAIKALVRWSVYCAGDRPQRPRRPAHARYFEIADDRACRTTRSSTPTSRWPTSTSRPSATGTGAPRTSRTSTSRSPTGSTSEPTSTGCSARPCDATYPAHEQDEFMAHFKGLTDLWAADNKH